MTSSKISSKIVELTPHTSCEMRVPQSNNYYITQSPDGAVMLGVMHQRIYFGGQAEKWSYENVDCLTETCIASIKATNTERISMRGGWKTVYFQDAMTGNLTGSAIVAELKSSNADFDPNDTTVPSVAIYFDIYGAHPCKGSILCPIGTKRNSVVVRYDSLTSTINVIILGIDGFTYNSFGIHDFVAACTGKGGLGSDKQLTFADTSYSSELHYPVLNENAFSPDGNLMLIHHMPDSGDDEDYCSVEFIYKPLELSEHKFKTSAQDGDKFKTSAQDGDKFKTSAQDGDKFKTSAQDGDKFKTYGKLCGNNQINWSPDQITVTCNSGHLVFNLVTGASQFVKEGVQNVNLHFKNWRREYQTQGHLYTIKGLSWRVPSTGRSQPIRTFVFEDDVQDEYEPGMTRINKSIPVGNISLDWALLFENDNVAIFKIGHRTVIGFDKLLQHQPIIYQLPKTTDYFDISAVTKDRIYASTFIDDDDEYGSFGGQIIVDSCKFDFAARIERFIRMDKLPNMPAGGASIMIAKFLVQQKKN
jgi:hypothetical protein